MNPRCRECGGRTDDSPKIDPEDRCDCTDYCQECGGLRRGPDPHGDEKPCRCPKRSWRELSTEEGQRILRSLRISSE